MQQLNQCGACFGFIPSDATSCPHCAPFMKPQPPPDTLATRLRNALKTLVGKVLGTPHETFAQVAPNEGELSRTTLMASYGAPPNLFDESTPTRQDLRRRARQDRAP